MDVMANPTQVQHQVLDSPPWGAWHNGGKRHGRSEQEFKEPCGLDLLAICGEFTQMVMVTKVFQHGTPCLKLEPKWIPLAKTLDVACTGPIGEKAYILWPCNYLI
jgi:hypothetical protein